MIRVVLADDHHIVRDGLVRVIAETQGMRVVGQAATGAQLLAVLEDVACDVLVLDLNMPEMRGIDSIHQVHALFPAVRIVVFSMFPEDTYAVSALRAGAKAFLSKTRAPSELLAAIRKVHAGGTYVTPELAEHILRFEIDLAADPHESLSSREREIFLRIATGQTPTDIAKELRLGRSTVTTHVHRIKRKLGVRSIGDIVRYAHLRGLVE